MTALVDGRSAHQVVSLITVHTCSNLILRPPGTLDQGAGLDEPQLKALGTRMASRNGYANIPGYGLYETTGTTEDWSYWSTGGLACTFEVGPEEFHPPYEIGVVAEYLGLPPAEGAGDGGNRQAFCAGPRRPGRRCACPRASRPSPRRCAGTSSAPARVRCSRSRTSS